MHNNNTTTTTALVLCLVVFIVTLLAQEAHAQVVISTTASGTLRQVLEAQKATSFIDIVDKANLSALIDASTNHTVFAPHNGAFKKFKSPSGAELVALVQYHFSADDVVSSSLVNGQLIPSILNLATLNNAPQQLKVTVKKEKHKTDIQINDADILKANIPASNGVAQIIKHVLVPPKDVTIVSNTTQQKSLSTLASLLKAANLTSALASQSDVTVFAPTNDVFQFNSALVGYLGLPNNAQDLISTLLNHVVAHTYYAKDIPFNFTNLITEAKNTITLFKSDKGVTINNSTAITEVDILASNGAIHKISDILVLPSFVFTFEKALLGLNDTTFLDELNATGLLDTLMNTTEKYTLFAPTDKAWKNSEPHLSTKKMADRISILQRHIVKGSYQKFKDGQKLINLNGNHLLVISNKTYTAIHLNDYTGDATKVAHAGTIENGVVYALDHVIPAVEVDEPLDTLITIIIVCICVPLLIGILLIVVVFDVRRWLKKRQALSYSTINY